MSEHLKGEPEPELEEKGEFTNPLPEEQPFITRLELWLQEQPEWLALMSGTRDQRRATARLLALHMVTFQEGTKGPGRAAMRKEVRRLRADHISPALVKVGRRAARLRATQEKDRRRYLRLQVERAHELALQEDRARAAIVAQALLDDMEGDGE